MTKIVSRAEKLPFPGRDHSYLLGWPDLTAAVTTRIRRVAVLQLVSKRIRSHGNLSTNDNDQLNNNNNNDKSMFRQRVLLIT